MSTSEAIDIALSFDTTGSMYPCLTQVRRKAAEFVRQNFRDIDNLRMAIITHGDYCDGDKVINILDFTNDEDVLVRFINNAPRTHGGDAPECYELVLNRVRKLSWRSGKAKAFVLIGDDVPHGPEYRDNTENIDWRNELGLLMEAGINVYAVQALSYYGSERFYQEVAEKTGGVHLQLPQFSAIRDLIMAISYKQQGKEALLKFEAEVEKAGRMTVSIGASFDALAGRTVRVVPTAAAYRGGGARRSASSSVVASGEIDETKLKPVHPSRFQVLDIDTHCPIREFVNENGLEFKTGKGFYEFIKTVKVQNYKEVVLVNQKTGEMFSGNQARTMLGLPVSGEGGTVSLRPGTLSGYTAFIQSTSYNRKLLAGTKFLYEVPDHDEKVAAA